MSEMVWRPSLTDLDAERAVILEEIAMYEDDPQDRVFDLLGRAIFGDDPLGRAIIGRKEVVAGTPREAIAGFHAERYVPRNVVVAAAGSVDHDALAALVAERERTAGDGHFAPGTPVPATQPRVKFERKDTEQYHVCLGGPGLARDDERRFALRVLDTLLGGASSSRLFQEVREKRGLAYAVYTFSAHHAGTGQVGVYLGTRGDNVAAALGIVAEELERVRTTPPSAVEVDRARDNLKGRIVLGLESTSARMNRLGSSLLTQVPLLSVDEAIAAIDAVTPADVAALATELWDPARLSVAAIGPDEAVLHEAVAPLRAAAPVVSSA
jgi:predicted Zn-dependent peptidase